MATSSSSLSSARRKVTRFVSSELCSQSTLEDEERGVLAAKLNQVVVDAAQLGVLRSISHEIFRLSNNASPSERAVSPTSMPL